MLYALLCQAHKSPGSPAAFPEEMMLDAPEQSRTTIWKNDCFAFGGTILAAHPETVQSIVQRLSNGLEQLGRSGKPRSKGLGGNFRLESIEDLVSGSPSIDHRLTALSQDHIDQELRRVESLPTLTLWFTSPLRVERPRKRRRPQHRFLDDRYFDAGFFVRQIARRLTEAGIMPRSADVLDQLDDQSVRLVESRLVWIDIGYGGRTGKTLGGLVGRVKIAAENLAVRSALVWGQYNRVGKSTRFGFGKYRIEELGEDPFQCRRGVPLLETAWRHPAADRIAMQSNLEPGELSAAVQQIRSKNYCPDRHQTITIGAGEKRRQLKIPSRRDRGLQRLVLEAIVPGVDQLFESSSFAWRKGLGRHSSARAVKRAFQQGYQFAIQADFDRFFESIPHDTLWDRAQAYIGDDETVDLLRTWVAAGQGEANRGIPTGAPLSPFLGNLLLDRFDEIVASRGGRLVRYGDDFLILFRRESEAAEVLGPMLEEVEKLQLKLNNGNPAVTDSSEPFTFLGFRFECYDRWTVSGQKQPVRIEEMGWFDANRNKPARRRRIVLDGETGESARDIGFTAIVGPAATHLELDGGKLACHYSGGRRKTEIPLADLESLVVLGALGINSQTLARLVDRQVNLWLADDRGEIFATVQGEHDVSGNVLQAQMQAANSAELRLQIARSLVRAKIHNYARLAESLPGGRQFSRRLTEIAADVQNRRGLDELMGTEGHAAAVWYELFGKSLGRGFTFERRVAPNAQDPVNVLLNIGHVWLYRLSALSARTAGLSPAIGFLHQANDRFQSLAADLQESFRFLVDRAVIQATHELRPGHFRRSLDGPYALSIAPNAARRFQKQLWETMHLAIWPTGGGEPYSYLVALQRQARALRRFLMHPQGAWRAFELEERSSG